MEELRLLLSGFKVRFDFELTEEEIKKRKKKAIIFEFSDFLSKLFQEQLLALPLSPVIGNWAYLCCLSASEKLISL